MAIKAANDKSMSNITALPSGVNAKSMILLATETASSSATISFTSDIDSTYKEYQFHYINVHAGNDDVALTFQVDTGTNTSYNQNVTNTYFAARHNESDSVAAVGYWTNRDLANSTSFVRLNYDTGNQTTDECLSGILHLYEPSSSTFVKHFLATTNDSGYTSSGAAQQSFIGGYFNTTTALTRVQFKMTGGNIDAGTIKMYGVV